MHSIATLRCPVRAGMFALAISGTTRRAEVSKPCVRPPCGVEFGPPVVALPNVRKLPTSRPPAHRRILFRLERFISVFSGWPFLDLAPVAPS